jgi:hypothetical protein
LTYDEAIAWMRVHGRAIEDQARAGDPGARPVSYRFTELLMDPHSVTAQQRLIAAILTYQAAKGMGEGPVAVPAAIFTVTPLPTAAGVGQRAIDAITSEEDQRALALCGVGDPSQGGRDA